MKLLIYILILAIFLPIAFNSSGIEKGLAAAYPLEEDFDRLNIDWYYVWGACPTQTHNCVPMSRDGISPNFSPDYSGYALLYNEPNGQEPYGHPVSVATAVERYMALAEEYPKVEWVVGNITFYGGWQDWLEQFYLLCADTTGCPIPQYWGVHIYVGGGDANTWIPFITDQLTSLHDKVRGTLWITEFAEINGNTSIDNAVVNLFEQTDWIDRYAYFTNRVKGDEAWLPPYFEGVRLFDWITGEPTVAGNWYIGR